MLKIVETALGNQIDALRKSIIYVMGVHDSPAISIFEIGRVPRLKYSQSHIPTVEKFFH